MKYSLILSSLADTENVAKHIAKVIVPNFVIALNGELGSGKTTLTRNILLSLGITGSIKSPTFTLVEPYTIKTLNIYHFDLYRFSDADEWFDAGFNEYFDTNSICFIEWAEKASNLIPGIDWTININLQDEARCCQIFAASEKGQECLKRLIKSVGK